MRKVEKLTQRLDHSVPDTKTRRQTDQIEAFKSALEAFIQKRKKNN